MVLIRRLAWKLARRKRLFPREVCKRCFRESPLGFRVPDEVWEAAVPPRYREKVLCILCFDELATARGVDWAKSPIEFSLVSGAMAREEA